MIIKSFIYIWEEISVELINKFDKSTFSNTSTQKTPKKLASNITITSGPKSSLSSPTLKIAKIDSDILKEGSRISV